MTICKKLNTSPKLVRAPFFCNTKKIKHTPLLSKKN